MNGTDGRHDRAHTQRLSPQTGGLSSPPNTVYSLQTVHRAFTVVSRLPERHFGRVVLTNHDWRQSSSLCRPGRIHCSRHIPASVKLDHVLGIDLIAVEDDVNLWVGHVVHAAVVEAGEAGVLGGRPAVHVMAYRVLPHQNSGQEHGFVGRLVGEDGGRQPVFLQGDVVLPRRVTEFTGVFGVPGKIASWSGTIE